MKLRNYHYLFVVVGLAIAATLISLIGVKNTQASSHNHEVRNVERVTPYSSFSSRPCPEVWAIQYDGKTYLVTRGDDGVAIVEHKKAQ